PAASVGMVPFASTFPAPLPSRSASCALNRLAGLTAWFIDCQCPSPTKRPQQPMAQLCAPGGARQVITGAVHWYSTQVAAAQPAPWPSVSRLVSASPPPSIVTLSYSAPLAQLSMGPLNCRASLASQWTKALGPGAR